MKGLRIGFYWHPVDGGQGRCFQGLLEALLRRAPQHEYFVYVEGAPASRRVPQHPRVHRRVLPSHPGTIWTRVQRQLPRHLHQDQLDVFHTQHHRFPICAPCRTVVTLHDLGVFLRPQGTVRPSDRRVTRQRFLAAARLADHVTTASRYAQQQLVETLKVPAQRISYIPWGCPPGFGPLPRDRARRMIRRCYRVIRPYILAVGPLFPCKGHVALIRAFQRTFAATHDLVIVGQAPEWWEPQILRAIGNTPAIHYLGFVTDLRLCALYVAAECLAYPSEEENYGFPAVEAMACGTPVVAWRRPSVPEAEAPTALLVAPGAFTRFTEGVRLVLADPTLRETLRRQGLARAHAVQWDETATQMLDVYHCVAGAGHSAR